TMSETSPKPRAAAKISARATVRASPVAASGSRRRRRKRAARARNSSSAACSAGPWPRVTSWSGTATAPDGRPGWGPAATPSQLPPDRGAGQLPGPPGDRPGPPGGQLQLPGVVQVGQELLLQPGHDPPVAQRQVELVVEGERAVVE